MRVIHWFRSDLRITDNVALTEAFRDADEVLPLFVLDDHLLSRVGESNPRTVFMLRCLQSLHTSLTEVGSSLHVSRGAPAEILGHLCRELSIDRVYWNRDYSPYAKSRDEHVRVMLARLDVRTLTFKDRVEFESSEVRTGSGAPFKVFTPYKRKWREHRAALPAPSALQISRKPVPQGATRERVNLDALPGSCAVPLPPAGEHSARQRLTTFLEEKVGHYAKDRDVPAKDGTSRLSPYLRLGVISVRTCFDEAMQYRTFDTRSGDGVMTWTDELIWRDFYHGILDQHPHVLSRAFKPQYDAMAWDNDPALFQAWCQGLTGYPFIDAAMRELNQTGWMHNRARMVVASFLTKDLLIDWRWGERYFMERLVDGDPASNNGGWQWAASTGTDAQPYYRIFNPTRQGERFDPDGAYVRRWVPELHHLAAREIHIPRTAIDAVKNYPTAVVEHSVQRSIALERYKRCARPQ